MLLTTHQCDPSPNRIWDIKQAVSNQKFLSAELKDPHPTTPTSFLYHGSCSHSSDTIIAPKYGDGFTFASTERVIPKMTLGNPLKPGMRG